MKRPLILFKVRRREPVTDHHISTVRKYKLCHLPCHLGGIRIIAISHHIAVCLDVAKHGADHIALPLTVFMHDDRSRTLCDFRRTIGGVIVIDIDIRLREYRAEICHHLLNGQGFIPAGNKNSDTGHRNSFLIRNVKSEIAVV